MRIEQLEYLAAVVEHGSLRRASEQLHLSQPALSEAITKLERELSTPLLDRRRTGARITPEGLGLLGEITAVLDAVTDLRAAAAGTSSPRRALRVGTVSTASSALVNPAVQDLHDRSPEINLELVHLQPHEIEQGLAEGTLDLGLINALADDPDPAGLRSTVLVHGHAVAVLPGGHALAGQQTVSTADLRAHAFVSMRAGFVMNRFAQRLFGRDFPAVTYRADGAGMGKSMVAEGIGLTLLPDFSVIGDPLHRAGLITERPLDTERTEVTLVLVEHATSPSRAGVAEVRAALLDRAQAYVGPAA